MWCLGFSWMTSQHGAMQKAIRCIFAIMKRRQCCRMAPGSQERRGRSNESRVRADQLPKLVDSWGTSAGAKPIATVARAGRRYEARKMPIYGAMHTFGMFLIANW